MSANSDNWDRDEDFAWRRPAPLARGAAMVIYSWKEPGWSFLWSVLAAAPFIMAAVLAPALLSLSPTVDMIAPIAEARAISAGADTLRDNASPFYVLLLLAADIFAEAPGRIHLLAKALSALFVVYPMAYFASSRLPIIPAALTTGALGAYVASPFAGPSEFALAIFLATSFCFIAASADNAPARARFEGLIAGVGLFALWQLNPVFSLAGFIALSACPFLSGRCGLSRYAATLAVFAVLAGLAEWLAPGINIARASAASGVLQVSTSFSGGDGAMGLSGVAVSTVLILLSASVFGGREHLRSWLTALLLGITAFIAARLTGANALPVFVLVAAIAVFSVSSPFYDGLFRNHDRASVSVALTGGALTLFWTVAIVVHAAGQFALQYQVAEAAPENIRTELALVQPGGPTIAQWIEEGRFSTVEAREFFALAPVDQSMMLLEAAGRAKSMAAEGWGVAILTGADTACVLAERRQCEATGDAAASLANVVFVPRLDLDPATTAAIGRAEALLYTEFKLVEQTPVWEIWVRRGATVPASLLRTSGPVLYR
jgi:hypothetical protein